MEKIVDGVPPQKWDSTRDEVPKRRLDLTVRSLLWCAWRRALLFWPFGFGDKGCARIVGDTVRVCELDLKR